MADPAGAPLPIVGNVEGVQILGAVTKSGISGVVLQHFSLMALQAEFIVTGTGIVGVVDGFWISAFQHTEMVRTMGIMTRFALPLLDRSVQELLPLQLLLYVVQRRFSEGVCAVTAKAGALFIEGKQSLGSGEVTCMTVAAPGLLLDRLMGNFGIGQFIADVLMTPDTEIRHLFLQEHDDRRAMWIVAGRAGTGLYRSMGERGAVHGRGEVRVALKAQISHGPLEEPLLIGLMRVVAFGAGTYGSRAVHELPLQRGAIVASQAEWAQVFIRLQQKTPVGTVRFVAGKTIAILNRRVHESLISQVGVARLAERSALGRQFETVPLLLGWMLLDPLNMAGEAITTSYRRMQLFEGGNVGVTGGTHAGVGPGYAGREKKESGKRT